MVEALSARIERGVVDAGRVTSQDREQLARGALPESRRGVTGQRQDPRAVGAEAAPPDGMLVAPQLGLEYGAGIDQGVNERATRVDHRQKVLPAAIELQVEKFVSLPHAVSPLLFEARKRDYFLTRLVAPHADRGVGADGGEEPISVTEGDLVARQDFRSV